VSVCVCVSVFSGELHSLKMDGMGRRMKSLVPSMSLMDVIGMMERRTRSLERSRRLRERHKMSLEHNRVQIELRASSIEQLDGPVERVRSRFRQRVRRHIRVGRTSSRVGRIGLMELHSLMRFLHVHRHVRDRRRSSSLVGSRSP